MGIKGQGTPHGNLFYQQDVRLKNVSKIQNIVGKNGMCLGHTLALI